jgi:hypothetical protein
MDYDLAPIVLFIYNRPQHTKKTLQALHENKEAAHSILYVFADGPKDNASGDDLKTICETRDVVKEMLWCKEVILIPREKNMNLEDNVIDGITTVINKHGKAIILEDDLISSPYFLKYCNDGLNMYRDAKQVFSINGFMFPVNFDAGATTFLSPYATSSWGWATWADRWNQLELQPQYINTINDSDFLTNRFNFGKVNILYMLKHMNTWDSRWFYTAFVRNGLGLFPTKSLIKNIGFDSSGSHSGNEGLEQDISLSAIPLVYQDTIDLDKYAKFQNYFKPDPISVKQRVKARIKKFLHL